MTAAGSQDGEASGRGKDAGGACVGFDGACPLCTAGAAKVARSLGRRGIEVRPMQEPAVSERLGIDPQETPDAMRVAAPDGVIHAGIDAYLYLGQFVWWLRPLRWMARVPGGRWLLDQSYRFVARHRRTISRLLGLRKTAVAPTPRSRP